MKAITQHGYGPAADVLHLQQVERPQPRDGEVLVRVHAAGVGPHVWHATTGRPYLARLGMGLRAPKRLVPRSDIAGVVEALGPGVTQLSIGEEVYGVGDGAFAELACARVDQLAPKPANLTFADAAAVPVSACAALLGLRDAGRIESGQSVLVIGASGGIGTFAVQLAKAYGAKVTGICSTANVELVRRLGADHVVDYTRGPIAEAHDRYDLILDLAGRRSLFELRRALTPHGTLVLVGGEGGGPLTGGFERAVIWAPLLSLFVGQRLRGLISTERRDDLLFLTELIEHGRLRPIVTRSFALRNAHLALADEDEGHGRGKAVIRVVERTWGGVHTADPVMAGRT